jgi:hypothetical protein
MYIYMYIYIYICVYSGGQDCPAARDKVGQGRGGGGADGAHGMRRKEVGGRVRGGY